MYSLDQGLTLTSIVSTVIAAIWLIVLVTPFLMVLSGVGLLVYWFVRRLHRLYRSAHRSARMQSSRVVMPRGKQGTSSA